MKPGVAKRDIESKRSATLRPYQTENTQVRLPQRHKRAPIVIAQFSEGRYARRTSPSKCVFLEYSRRKICTIRQRAECAQRDIDREKTTSGQKLRRLGKVNE
jgi:hypothetical protein